MMRYLLLIVLNSSLWHMSLSQIECIRTINGGQISFQCPAGFTNTELNLYDYTVATLDSITSIVASGGNNTSIGPFTSLPVNLCLLRNLQTIDFSFNQIVQLDPTGSLTNCLTQVTSLYLQYNNIAQFPSALIYNMPNLMTLNFRNNQLIEVPANAFKNVSVLDTIDFSYNQLTTFELWVLEVLTRVDFSYNSISTITNKFNFNTFSQTSNAPNIFLTNNSPTINLTDAIYEMYNQCDGLDQVLNGSNSGLSKASYFTLKLHGINFGTARIRCSCDQAYLLTASDNLNGGSFDSSNILYPFQQTRCANDSLNSNNTYFFASSCSPYQQQQQQPNSSVSFDKVYPRLCKIFSTEAGGITIPTNFTTPTTNTSTYPHSQAVFLNPGACLFTFTNAATMSVHCVNDTTTSASAIPTGLLNSAYMTSITRVTFPSPISSLPFYLCSLPSHQIDLSYQAFTTLTDATFPCLDAFSKVILSNNQITSVNMASGNFSTLTSLDLSSNSLSTLPYSILRPTPSSLSFLDLRNNSFTSIDIFIYTLKKITVNLDNNPLSGSTIINSQNVTLHNNDTSSVNITLPSSVTTSTYVLQDSIVASLFSCSILDSTQGLINSLKLNRNVVLICTCASIGLRDLYRANNLSITNSLTCSNGNDALTFPTLAKSKCPNSITFSNALCPVPGQMTTEMTTMNSSHTSIEYTSASFTTIMTNSSSPSTLNTLNQTQITTPTSGTTLPGNASTTIVGSLNLSTTATTTITTTITTANSSTTDSTVAAPLLQSGTGGSTDHTGLIVGLVVGIIGFFLLLAILIAIIICLIAKKKKAAGKKKPVKSARANVRAPEDALSTRVQARNLRAVRLAPIPGASTVALPIIPVKAVVPSTNGSVPYPSTTSAKGIPVRLDAIRSPTEINPQYPPNSNALNNSSSFRPINNLPAQPPPVLQPLQAPKPRGTHLLNAGGDLRH